MTDAEIDGLEPQEAQRELYRRWSGGAAPYQTTSGRV
jgi:hypothetical protein